MTTLILDIDGTLTDLWPIEKSVLIALAGDERAELIQILKFRGVTDTYTIFCRVTKQQLSKSTYIRKYNQTFLTLFKCGRLPKLYPYPLVDWIRRNAMNYRFVYATGGQRQEARYVLRSLGIIDIFDLKHSVDRTNCRFSKRTGIPLQRIRSSLGNCILITDSINDREGAFRANIPCLVLRPGQQSIDYKLRSFV